MVVIEGASGAASSEVDPIEEARRLVALGIRPRDAAKEVARRSSVSANTLYRALTEDRGEHR